MKLSSQGISNLSDTIHHVLIGDPWRTSSTARPYRPYQNGFIFPPSSREEGAVILYHCMVRRLIVSVLFSLHVLSILSIQSTARSVCLFCLQLAASLTFNHLRRAPKMSKNKSPKSGKPKKKKKKTDMLPREEQQQHRPKSGKSVTMTYHYNNTFSPLLRNQMKLTECFLQPAVFAWRETLTLLPRRPITRLWRKRILS